MADTDLAAKEDAPSSITTPNYASELMRLNSFINWPKPQITPEKLAAAGLYYTGTRDETRCFCCQVIIYDWQGESDPMESYRFSQPECRFVKNLPCGNLPIIDYTHFMVPTTDQCENSAPNTNTETRPVTRSQTRPTAMRPEYALYTDRLRTYMTWPKFLQPTKERLTEAGFYYTGFSDQVACHYCGGQLRNWEPRDDPWQKHMMWFNSCTYVLSVKGPSKVNRKGSESDPLLHRP